MRGAVETGSPSEAPHRDPSRTGGACGLELESVQELRVCCELSPHRPTTQLVDAIVILCAQGAMAD